jgi:hypothetical protein
VTGGSAGNARLTGRTAVVLLVLLALEGATILSIRALLLPHVFLGLLLVPPVLVKLGSVGWRMTAYYRRSEEYVRLGPPHALLRVVVAPVLVVSTVTLFASGVAVVAMRRGGLLLGLHKASFVVWFGAMSVHVLWHVRSLPRLVVDRLPGRHLRLGLLAAALAVGVVLAVATIPLADRWQDHATAALGLDAR